MGQEKIEKLRANRSGYAVHWMRFLRLSTRIGDDVICVFEGEDAKYFGWRLDSIAAVSWRPAGVGGRDNVLAILRLSQETSQHYNRSYFFIDRDFDEDASVPMDPRLYVTPMYAVENFYCTEDAIGRLLRDEFGCPLGGANEDAMVLSVECHGKIREMFVRVRDSFLAGILDLNAWAVCHRRREKAKPGAGRLILNDINVLDFVNLEIDSCTISYNLADIHAKYSKGSFPTEDEMADARAFLKQRGLLSSCRGKFLVPFLRAYVNKLKDDAYVHAPSLVTNGSKPKILLSERNILSEFTQFADTPNCLKKFLLKMSN